MKRTTIFIDEGIERELRIVARRRGRSVAAVVRDAIAREVAAEARRPPSFVGMGDSGRHDVAERHEELLFRALLPHGPGAGKQARRPTPRPARGRQGGSRKRR